MELIRLTIKGQPPRKSNDRRIVVNRRTGKPMSIKSKAALEWVEYALRTIPAEARQGVGSPTQPLCITYFVRYRTRAADLSVELIKDALEKAGVISNDRYVFEDHALKFIDKENPGVDIIIEGTEE